MRVNVAELMTDDDFVTTFTRLRPTLSIGDEGVADRTWVRTEDLVGIVQPAGPEDLEVLSQGMSHKSDFIAIYTEDPLLMSNADDSDCDVVIWREAHYRVCRSEEFDEHGYHRAFAEHYVAGTVMT